MTYHRRNVLRTVAGGLAGATLASSVGKTVGASRTARDESPLEYTDVQKRNYVQDFEGYPGYTPTDREHRVFTSVVGHTGPRPIPGVPDEVQYTVVVSTSAAIEWIDEFGGYDSPSENVRQIENVIDYDGPVRASFPSDEDWIGGHQWNPDGDGPIDAVADDSTVVGAVVDVGWDFLSGAVPYLGEALAVLDFVTDLASVDDDETQHTATFDYPVERPQAATSTYRKFTLQMDRRDTAELTIRNRIGLERRDYERDDFVHTIQLDPDSFVSDVDGHPFETEIRTLVDEGVISGYPDGTFRPDRPLTRAEFASMIAEAFDPDPTTLPEFSDVEDHWAERSVRRVAGSGFFGGYPDGTFRPDQRITKTETIVALDSGLGYGGGDPDALASAYDDADAIPDWAREAVADAHAVWNGIENYPDSDRLTPTADATRAEAAKYVYDASH